MMDQTKSKLIMKKLLHFSLILIALTACNNKDKREAEIQKARQAAIDSVNMVNSAQKMPDLIHTDASAPMTGVTDNEVNNTTVPVNPPPHRKGTTPKKETTPVTPPVTKTDPVPDKPVTGTTPTVQSTSTPAPADNTTVVTTEEKKKKGLNNAAKGAIIGLGTGAAAGAVINKDNRGKGAVIGGVVGAIGGAVGGAVLDKRKAKKEAAKDTIKPEDKK
jgi:outer membrane lipoprotein SlyB